MSFLMRQIQYAGTLRYNRRYTMVSYESGCYIMKKGNNCLRKQIIAAGDINNQKLDHRQKPTKQFEQIPLETIIQNRYSGIK